MAFLARDDPDNLIPCPFDDTHMITHKRYQYHISDCRKNHPNSKLKQCPFNARHWINESEYRFHLANCPDSQHIEKEQQHYGEVKLGGYLKVPDYDDSISHISTEEWDAEPIAPHFVLGQPVYEDFTPHAGAHVPAARVIPGLSADVVQVQPKYDTIRQQRETADRHPQPRAPRQAPQVLQATPNIPNRAGGRGLASGDGGLAQPSWTAAGRGRGRGGLSAFSPGISEESSPSSSRDRSPLCVSSLSSQETQPSQYSPSRTQYRPNGEVRQTNVAFRPMPTRGRGAGRGIMSITSEAILQGGRSPFVSMATDSPLSSDSQDQFDDDVDREKLKEERKLRKRLKQIEVLQQKQASGQALTQQEIDKIQRKSSLLQQLADLKVVND